jgi:uncharacterized protein
VVLVDVNVLVYAHHAEAVNHHSYRRWLEDLVNSDQPYGMAELVLAGFLRIMTHPNIFRVPAPPATAIDALRLPTAREAELCDRGSRLASLANL